LLCTSPEGVVHAAELRLNFAGAGAAEPMDPKRTDLSECGALDAPSASREADMVDAADSESFAGQASCQKQQTQAASEPAAEGRRHALVSLPSGAVDRQLSSQGQQLPGLSPMECFWQGVQSPGDFCREVTEQQWPNYTLPAQDCPAEVEFVDSRAGANFQSFTMGPFDTGECFGFVPMPMPSFSPAFAMNAMFWRGMSSSGPGANGFDVGIGTGIDAGSSVTGPSYMPAQSGKAKNKQKSLITLAKEAQDSQRMQVQPVSNRQFETLAEQSKDGSHAMPHAMPDSQSDVDSGTGEQVLEECSHRFCPRCGHVCKRHFAFCQSCGTAVASIWDV
jgi:hypothetical protein